MQVFKNAAFGEVRVTEADGQPAFCLADICKALGIANPRNVRARLDGGDVRQIDTPTESGTQAITYVTEAGLYEVIIRSDAPAAKPFRKWVTTEVIPAIRKHGGYLTPETVEAALLNPDTLIRLATGLKEERAKRIAAESERDAMQPKALFADAVASSGRSCLVAELAKILQQNGYAIGQNRLFEWMREKGYLGTKGEYYNQPTQRAMDLGLFEVKKSTVTKPDGSILVTATPKITGKGQIYFVNKFLNGAA